MTAQSLSVPLTKGLGEVVEGIFENMLELPLTQAGVAQAARSGRLRAFITLEGSWHAVIALECSAEQAHRFAARFLSLDVDQISGQMASDVLKELVNMIAGNLKAAFAPDLRLAVSGVSEDSPWFVTCFCPSIREQVDFKCEEGAFTVSVVAALPPLARKLFICLPG